MLNSPILNEFHELKQEKIAIEDLSSNWFSIDNAFRVYNHYVRLDLD